VKYTALLTTLILMPFICSCASVVTESESQKASAYYNIGVGHLSENKIQQAFVEFQRAYELNPNNKEVLNAIGIIYLGYFDETQKAIDSFKKQSGWILLFRGIQQSRICPREAWAIRCCHPIL